MSHFNLKSLAFYGAAIGAVVILFSFTTRYGEAHIKAPADITGRYPISNQTLPGCLNAKPLVLDIRQSGVYLAAALVEAKADKRVIKAVEQRPPLSGEWDSQQFSLTGSLTHIQACQETVAIAGTIQDGTMTANLNLDSSPEKIPFTAQKELPETAQ
ncbi:MAG TPA: hypothetical protein V6C57_20975 [Coleofasciculaceae cyanobacterium]